MMIEKEKEKEKALLRTQKWMDIINIESGINHLNDFYFIFVV